MAKIKVNDIKLAGADLFEDAESFIRDLEDNDLELTGGLLACACCAGSHNGTIGGRSLMPGNCGTNPVF